MNSDDVKKRLKLREDMFLRRLVGMLAKMAKAGTSDVGQTETGQQETEGMVLPRKMWKCEIVEMWKYPIPFEAKPSMSRHALETGFTRCTGFHEFHPVRPV